MVTNIARAGVGAQTVAMRLTLKTSVIAPAAFFMIGTL